MTDEEAEKFKNTLQESLTFPCVYMYKFIVKSENRNIALVENLFEAGAEIFSKESGGGKYISITVSQVSLNVEEIISIYKKAAKIKGIIFL